MTFNAFRIEHAVLIFYAVLLAVGGILGFARARSKASLISGTIAAIAAGLAAGLSLLGYRFGIPLGVLLALVMFLMFGYRYAIRNKTFMPSGMLAVVSMVVLLLLLFLSDWTTM